MTNIEIVFLGSSCPNQPFQDVINEISFWLPTGWALRSWNIVVEQDRPNVRKMIHLKLKASDDRFNLMPGQGTKQKYLDQLIEDVEAYVGAKVIENLFDHKLGRTQWIYSDELEVGAHTCLQIPQIINN